MFRKKEGDREMKIKMETKPTVQQVASSWDPLPWQMLKNASATIGLFFCFGLGQLKNDFCLLPQKGICS